jgi:hypothetical protein
MKPSVMAQVKSATPPSLKASDQPQRPKVPQVHLGSTATLSFCQHHTATSLQLLHKSTTATLSFCQRHTATSLQLLHKSSRVQVAEGEPWFPSLPNDVPVALLAAPATDLRHSGETSWSPVPAPLRQRRRPSILTLA